MINDKFKDRLIEFLNSECNDYDIEYSLEYNLDTEYYEVEIKRYDNLILVEFNYDEDKDVLIINMGEDNWYEVKEYDWSVKYFWMLVSSRLFK